MRGMLFRRRRRSLNRPILVAALAVLLSLIARLPCADAQVASSNAQMRAVGNAPRGLPIEAFLEKSISTLAREMLLEGHLDKQAPKPQQSGFQMELFAPGDFGVVVRYRW
jgi:hypothetical protein